LGFRWTYISSLQTELALLVREVELRESSLLATNASHRSEIQLKPHGTQQAEKTVTNMVTIPELMNTGDHNALYHRT
jgi:hypothetical protein